MRTVSILLAIFALTSFGASLWIYKQFIAYQVQHPPTSDHKLARCDFNGLVAHWKFDEATGSEVRDSSRGANHAVVAFAPGLMTAWRHGSPETVPGRAGNALGLNGKHWVAAENNNCFTSEVLTLAAWVWQADEVGEMPTIAAKSAWPTDGWWLCTTKGDDRVANRLVDFGISTGSSTLHVSSGYQLPLREWHHVVASLNNQTHEAEFFIDGKRHGDKKTGVPRWQVNWNHALFVGEYDGSGRWPWRGKLDDIRVYNTALTEQEVTQLYTSFDPGQTKITQ